jgi:predicted ABC-type ATPase
MEGGHDVPITKIISRYYKSISNCRTVAELVDRLYVYDNSIEDTNAEALFRLTNGRLAKKYKENLPFWAKSIIPNQE